MNYQTLKEKQRKLRDDWSPRISENIGVRIHRALSWLKASEENTKNKVDDSIAFITLWIAFNALYGQKNISKEVYSERESFNDFFSYILPCDKEHEIKKIILTKYSNSYRIFIDNKFVFQSFWDFQNGLISETESQEKFDLSKEKSHISLANLMSKEEYEEDCIIFLGILFDRLYLLRNQLIHGCATFAGKVNAEQIKLAKNILEDMVPILINILLENPEIDLGEIPYPVIE